MEPEDRDRFDEWWFKTCPEPQHQVFKPLAEQVWNAALDYAEEVVNDIFNQERKLRAALKD